MHLTLSDLEIEIIQRTNPAEHLRDMPKADGGYSYGGGLQADVLKPQY